MDYRFDPTVLVKMSAASEHNGSFPGGQGHGHEVAAVSGNNRCAESGQLTERDPPNSLAQAINSSRPSRTKDEAHVDVGEG